MAANHFLKIDGIKGGATQEGHQGEIEVLSLNWGTHPSSGGTGPGAGRVRHLSLDIVKPHDVASHILLLRARDGQQIDSAVLTMRGSGGSSWFARFRLTDLIVTHVQSGGNGQEGPLETVTFIYKSRELD